MLKIQINWMEIYWKMNFKLKFILKLTLACIYELNKIQIIPESKTENVLLKFNNVNNENNNK